MLIYHPHDKLVSKMLDDKRVAIDLLKSSLSPKKVAKLDFSTLQPTAETAVGEDWKKYHNDVVFHCKTKAQKNVYIIIEHQSTPDRFMPLRILRYKYNLIGKYIDAKNPPEKIPNVISLVIYHGEKEYPYSTDVVACFEDEELATNDLEEPMHVLNLKKVSEAAMLRNGGADSLLKFLLKYSREKNFIQRIQAFMKERPNIFLSLSAAQAKYIFEYIFNVGKGTPENARIMKAAMNQLYGAPKAKKIFSLADYFRLEAKKEGKQEGRIEGMRKGIEKGRQEGREQGMIMLAAELKKAGVSQEIIERAVQQQKEACKS